jgi:hypothetical protein
MKRLDRYVALFAGCSLLLASCNKTQPTSAPAAATQPAASAKPKELLVGKWQGADPGKESEKLEITADGKISGDAGGFAYNGKYKWVEDDAVIQYEVKPDLGSIRQVKCKVKVGKDDLTLEIVDAQSRTDDGAQWQHEADDKARIGTVEKYKRQP